MLVDSSTCLKMGGKLEAFEETKPAEPKKDSQT
jgi:hypothetical protein